MGWGLVISGIVILGALYAIGVALHVLALNSLYDDE